jgi:hypothetical protein
MNTHALCISDCPHGNFTIGKIYCIDEFKQYGDYIIQDVLVNCSEWHLKDDDGLSVGFRGDPFFTYFEDGSGELRQRKIDNIL